jgi:hypothetical protein
VVANISATATSVAPAHLLRISQIGRVFAAVCAQKAPLPSLVFKDFVNKTFTVMSQRKVHSHRVSESTPRVDSHLVSYFADPVA